MPMPERLLRATEDRLWDLVRQRIDEATDPAVIDAQIWDLFGERWAVMFTDLSGFSRRVEEYGISHFLQVIYRQREILFPVIRDHGGVLVKAEADSLLLLFRSPTSALACGVAMQRACGLANQRLVDKDQVHLCLGIGYGDLLRIGDHDVWGREVNIASKLGEDTARSGEILVTRAVVEALGDALPYPTEPLEVSAAGADDNVRVRYLS